MPGIALDLTISFGNIVEIAVIGGGGISVVAVMKTTLTAMRKEFSDSKEATTMAISDLKHDTKEQITGIQSEIKRLGEVLINQADQIRRIIRLEEDIRDLRHGRGFITGERGVDHEYP